MSLYNFLILASVLMTSYGASIENDSEYLTPVRKELLREALNSGATQSCMVMQIIEESLPTSTDEIPIPLEEIERSGRGKPGMGWGNFHLQCGIETIAIITNYAPTRAEKNIILNFLEVELKKLMAEKLPLEDILMQYKNDVDAWFK